MKKIYLACPYSHPEDLVRRLRAHLATVTAAQLASKGFFVYSPLVHKHALSRVGTVPGDGSFWQAHCASFLTEWADALFVLPLEGWKESIEVVEALALAERHRLDVQYLEQDIIAPGDTLILNKEPFPVLEQVCCQCGAREILFTPPKLFEVTFVTGQDDGLTQEATRKFCPDCLSMLAEGGKNHG